MKSHFQIKTFQELYGTLKEKNLNVKNWLLFQFCQKLNIFKAILHHYLKKLNFQVNLN